MQNSAILVKACLNGPRKREEHEAVPLSPLELARDAAFAVSAGAGALHAHARRTDGSETLEPETCGAVVEAIRGTCPNTPLGLSTAAWIEPDPAKRISSIISWKIKPDFASVNFGEAGALGVCNSLTEKRIGIEAGIWSVSDAKRYLDSEFRDNCIRVLVEVVDKDPSEAVNSAKLIDEALDKGDCKTRRLHHGYGKATWAVLEAALSRKRDIRVGLEDTIYLPDGSRARNNSDLIQAAVNLVRLHHLKIQRQT